jgi:hypothetical protein
MISPPSLIAPSISQAATVVDLDLEREHRRGGDWWPAGARMASWEQAEASCGRWAS